MDAKCVHYVQFGVQDGLKLVHDFTIKYNFRLAATRVVAGTTQWLMRSHAIRFLITQAAEHSEETKLDPFIHTWNFSKENNSKPVQDSVFNIALSVKNIEACVSRLETENVQIVKPLQTVADKTGSVRVCTIKSCVGNVLHTLVEDHNYSGRFLPGFQDVDEIPDDEDKNADDDNKNADDDNKNADDDRTHVRPDLLFIDHVALCVGRGMSVAVIEWYERCLSMKRFYLHRTDEEQEGFVISGAGLGMRLKALEYWRCAETGVSSSHATGSLKLVVSEALPDQGPNAMDMFLANHGGPGVQHIGLYTGDITRTVSALMTRGVVFNEPPYTYYTEAGRLKEMVALGVNVHDLQRNGILVDVEEDDQEKDDDDKQATGDAASNKSVRYLMQKFTRPLFDSDTFFLEAIQRVGATGFGSGNITALLRSLEVYMVQKDLNA